jgi:hypothetical protein
MEELLSTAMLIIWKMRQNKTAVKNFYLVSLKVDRFRAEESP